MSDNTDKKVSDLATAFANLGDSPFGGLLGVALFFLVIFGFVLLMVKWDGHIYNRKGCVQLQEIKGKVFKVDTCTGKVERLKEEKESTDKRTHFE